MTQKSNSKILDMLWYRRTKHVFKTREERRAPPALKA